MAKDGSNVKDTYKVMAVPKATYVTASELYEGRKINVYDGYFADTAGGTQKGYKYVINTDVQGGYVQASSSNKKVAEVTTFKEKNKSTGAVELKLWVTPRKTRSGDDYAESHGRKRREDQVQGSGRKRRAVKLRFVMLHKKTLFFCTVLFDNL